MNSNSFKHYRIPTGEDDEADAGRFLDLFGYFVPEDYDDEPVNHNHHKDLYYDF